MLHNGGRHVRQCDIGHPSETFVSITYTSVFGYKYSRNDLFDFESLFTDLKTSASVFKF